MACTQVALAILRLLQRGPRVGMEPTHLDEERRAYIQDLAGAAGVTYDQASEDVLHEFDRLPRNPHAGVGLEPEGHAALDINRPVRH